jgi:hypothetical protein
VCARARMNPVHRLSTSSDLHHDAERDMGDLGAAGVKIINNCQALDKEQRALGLSKDFQEGTPAPD